MEKRIEYVYILEMVRIQKSRKSAYAWGKAIPSIGIWNKKNTTTYLPLSVQCKALEIKKHKLQPIFIWLFKRELGVMTYKISVLKRTNSSLETYQFQC